MQAVLPYTRGYIWQDGAFSLQDSRHIIPSWDQGHSSRKPSAAGEAPSDCAKLWGTTSFGDNVEDEWFIVWLLLHLTLKVCVSHTIKLALYTSYFMQVCKHISTYVHSQSPPFLSACAVLSEHTASHVDHGVPLQFSNISARVWDNDGDFLLIEAAFSLPRWLKPEVSTNRVWLHDGQLHIVPLPNKRHLTLPASPTLTEALQIIASEGVSTQANTGMQSAITSRVKGYPKKALAEMHRARCLVPAKVAAILKQQPQLVSSAVQAFYYRDVQDMKAAAKLKNFPSEVGLPS